jgi:hypothetical protein
MGVRNELTQTRLKSPFYGPEFCCGVSAQEIGHRLIEPALATSIDRCGHASDGYSTVPRPSLSQRCGGEDFQPYPGFRRHFQPNLPNPLHRRELQLFV